ncbi:MAG: dTDP-glucose 4,6-dehydratase, partial [Bacteroidota bacterium]
MNNSTHILVTGGAGFIGSHLVKLLISKGHHVVVFDALTYAGHKENLAEVLNNERLTFVQGNIASASNLEPLFESYNFNCIFHLAAESHVDRSIEGPLEFVKTNVMGTVQLLEFAKRNGFINGSGKCFFHVSTDEVFGTLGNEGKFSEHTPYSPRSPYSASKASSDHFVRAYSDTYDMPILISNCSNNFGTHQFPEKLIPVVVNSLIQRNPIPVYGKGLNVRDWLWVEDHVRAIYTLWKEGEFGETYCIGGNNEWNNLDLVKLIVELFDEIKGNAFGTSNSLITFVTDRLGHDLRYAIDHSKIIDKTSWRPTQDFKSKLKQTILWYIENQDWVKTVTN